MTDKKHYFIILTPIILIIVNFILKILFLSFNSVGGDEPFSIYHAQMDVSSIIHHLSYGNNPPFYEIMLHFWIKIFGISEFSVRFPSLIFSVSTVYFVYKIGKDFFSYSSGLVAGLLFTFSNYQLAFSHEARVYALFALLTAVSMFLFLIICRKPDSFIHLFFLLVINVILLYSHYFGFFIITIQTIAMLIFKEIRKPLMRKYLVYFILLLLLYIPNLNIIITRFFDTSIHGSWVKSPNGIESIYNMLWQFSNKPITTVISIIILFAAFIKSIFGRDLKSISVNTKIVLIWFLLPFFSMFVFSFWIPMFLDRYLIFVSLGYYLVLAFCAAYIFQQRKLRLMIPGILILFFAATFNPNVDNNRHVKETIGKIKELKDQNTAVLICPQHFILNFAYYFDRDVFRDVDGQHVYSGMIENFKKDKIFAVNKVDEAPLDGFEKIVYLDAAAQFSCPDNNIVSTLNKNFLLKSTHPFYEIFTVYEFIKK